MTNKRQTGKPHTIRQYTFYLRPLCMCVCNLCTMPRLTRKTSRGRGKGRQKPSPPQSSPLSNPIPSDPADSSHEEHPQVESDNPSDSSRSRNDSPIPLPEAKRVKKTTDLTLEEEEDMAEWIAENESIYNKKMKDYKDKQKKDKLWNDKAEAMGRTSEMLQIWYRSLRTRFGRLLKRKSGQGVPDLTERDEWVMAKFAFLKVHIYNVQRRTMVSVSHFLFTYSC